jgi:hypothetical protein
VGRVDFGPRRWASWARYEMTRVGLQCDVITLPGLLGDVITDRWSPKCLHWNMKAQGAPPLFASDMMCQLTLVAHSALGVQLGAANVAVAGAELCCLCFPVWQDHIMDCNTCKLLGHQVLDARSSLGLCLQASCSPCWHRQHSWRLGTRDVGS